MGRVVHFEIHAADPERASAFYARVLGWEIHKWDGPWPYWLIRTGPQDERGIDGAIVERRGELDGQAVTAFVCTASVADVDATVAEIEAAGGELALPPMDVPGVGRLAYGRDTEGNIFGVLQPVG
jgi:predicted enzyme related to lactoylglutathione lyase